MSSRQLLSTPSVHQNSLATVVDSTFNYAKDAIISVARMPFAALCEQAATTILKRITVGTLTITTPQRIYVFGSGVDQAVDLASSADSVSTLEDVYRGPTAELRVLKETFWVRLVTMSDLGFAEAFMYGDIDCDDLVALFQIFIQNRKNLSSLGDASNSLSTWMISLPQRIFTSQRFMNTISNSRANISAHYDISNRMFEAFLSKDLTYSCGIYPDLNGDIVNYTAYHKQSNYGNAYQPNGAQFQDEETPLYQSQMTKLHHILKKADIRPGHRVLELGSGWGSFAILAAQSVPRCTIDTITLSIHQQVLAQKRVAEAGLSDRIQVHLMDYRHLPQDWMKSFDRVVSIEMIEAVGKEFLETYWQTVDWALKDSTGVGVVQVITIPEARFEQYSKDIDFIRKWIFPGGFLPSLTFLIHSLEKGSKGKLVVDSVSNIGPHYSRTLRDWNKRFQDRFDDTIAPTLREEHPDVMNGPRGREETEVFRRKWLYYFQYCEAGFMERILGVHIVAFSREGNVEYGCQTYE